MLTLTRKVGQRTLIGSIEVEVVEVRRDGVVIRLHGVEDESTVNLVDTSFSDTSSRPATRRRRVVPTSRENSPVVIKKRRSRG
ncbi:MAG: hypothetical protein ACE37F_00575 [Nannocystaceae bacterium]|nr:carbon storage regulator [bacterium]